MDNIFKYSILGITPFEAFERINKKYTIREFDNTNLKLKVNYIGNTKTNEILNVYTKNGKIFDVGKISY